MSFRQSDRLRQFRGQPAISAVDQPASPAERAFAAVTTLTMLLISAYLILM